MKSWKNNPPGQNLTHGNRSREAWLACVYIRGMASSNNKKQKPKSAANCLNNLICEAWRKRDHAFFSDIALILERVDRDGDSISASPELAALVGYYIEKANEFDSVGKVFTQTEISNMCECDYRTAGRIKRQFEALRGK